MRYQFDNFEFDSTDLILHRAGEALAIRHNEAKLLALLLENTHRVLSKEEILNEVWQGKVVSDQAVFQNISHLRALFGNDAIKTYAKRGYQWQRPVNDPVTGPKSELSDVQGKPVATSVAAATWMHRSEIKWLGISLCCLLVLVAVVFISQSDEPEQASFTLTYLPFEGAELEKWQLRDTARLDFTALSTLSAAHFRTSQELVYPEVAAQHPFILTASVRYVDALWYLTFWLKGPAGQWQGVLHGETPEAVQQQLYHHLTQPVVRSLLQNPHSPDLKLAMLTQAHQGAPQDLILLGALVNAYLDVRELEKAMAMAEKLAVLAKAQTNSQQLGRALAYQGEILSRKNLVDLSLVRLDAALDALAISQDLRAQADVWHSRSWLHHLQRDYEQVKASLLHSAQLAQQSQDIARELDALTYLSIMASKNQQDNDKYLYLRQAEEKMRHYALPIYHFAKVPFHYAIFANKPADKEPHYRRVLEYTALTPNHWVAQSSRKSLVRYYLSEGRYDEAKSLIDSVSQDNAENAYLAVMYAAAAQTQAELLPLALRAFELAQLSGDRRIGLDVALLLCQMPVESGVNSDFYAHYISEHATPDWRTQHEAQLLALNLNSVGVE
ncbi:MULTISPECIES: winged helix-turn-helix domain-containing protein [unclassified Pseudoalteromonas]|uniref:winged helix-turn-helix domain-containing protein n=1 Tax=unclassified Pseudoalteromonas TaxID=194690 RepID=UPI002097E98A|nr:winged helix-turn-helix domain-containing protein [Pseudoalteromonas sp. XMcav2-N]MCO7189766.1 winged helix-turn-helix domain-containing protein [Pseudoalteromonas sp. XMcav2-N]